MLDVKLFLFIIIGFFWGGLTAPVSIKLAGLYGIIDIPDARKSIKDKCLAELVLAYGSDIC